MYSEKIEQLIEVLENQELDVTCLMICFSVWVFNILSFLPQGGVSGQIYAELFAAYLYKGDL